MADIMSVVVRHVCGHDEIHGFSIDLDVVACVAEERELLCNACADERIDAQIRAHREQEFNRQVRNLLTAFLFPQPKPFGLLADTYWQELNAGVIALGGVMS